MKRTIFAILILCTAGLWAADPGAARPDLFGTPPAQWNYTTVVTTGVVNTAPGLLGRVTIAATCAVPISIYDSTTTTAGFLISIATVTATAGLSYDYTGLRTLNGITLGVGAACTSGVTVTYR